MDAACEIAAMDADVVCVAITGAAAIRPTLAAIDAGATVATATKEVLVMAGELVKARAAAAGARIIPIDSEHSALWQCLRGEDPASVLAARAHREWRSVPAPPARHLRYDHRRLKRSRTPPGTWGRR